MRKIHYNYLKPQNYYNRLLTFFLIIGFSLTIFLIKLEEETMETFLLKFIVIVFLMILIAIAIEFFYTGEYMNPLEVYDLEHFFLEFLSKTEKKGEIEKFFNKYDSKTKSKFKKTFLHKRRYFLSSIRKNKNTYELTLIDEKKLAEYFILKFLVKKAIHKIFIKKLNEEFKIIRIT
jgi:hypothetical protein